MPPGLAQTATRKIHHRVQDNIRISAEPGIHSTAVEDGYILECPFEQDTGVELENAAMDSIALRVGDSDQNLQYVTLLVSATRCNFVSLSRIPAVTGMLQRIISAIGQVKPIRY